MDTDQAKEPPPNETETAPQPWDKSSRQLQSALAEFEWEMKVCTETSEKVRKRLSLRNHALSSFTNNAEYAAIADKVETVMRNVVKRSTQVLNDAQSFADKGTECPICWEPLDQESNEPGPVMQINPCKHQFHYKCLEALQQRDKCPMCSGQVAEIVRVEFETGEIAMRTSIPYRVLAGGV
ncbi:hypothetical protein LTS10_001349 [Elasticomyces elasticus]|nr:hypothetical protein LTS10_001349 [Elasticomyces elasticus]